MQALCSQGYIWVATAQTGTCYSKRRRYRPQYSGLLYSMSEEDFSFFFINSSFIFLGWLFTLHIKYILKCILVMYTEMYLCYETK